MSFNGFLSSQKINVLTAGEKGPLGIFFPGDDQEMSNVRVQIYKQGNGSGSETLQVKCYNDEALTKEVYASNVVILTDATGVATNWIGWIRFDFSPRVNIDLNTGYFFTLETANYTRNEDVFYIGYCLDYVDEYASNIIIPSTADIPGKFEVFGYK